MDNNKPMKNNKLKIKNFIKGHRGYFLGLFFVVVLFFLIPQKVYTQFEIQYLEDPIGENNMVIVSHNNRRQDSGEIRDGVGSAAYWGPDFNALWPVEKECTTELYITSVDIFMYDIPVMHLNAEKMFDSFEMGNNINHMGAEDIGLNILTLGDEPALIPKEEFMNSLRKIAGYMAIINLVIMLAVYSLAYYLIIKLKKTEQGFLLYTGIAFVITGMAAMLASWGIALGSQASVITHPDEIQTKSAILYYINHWIQPNLRADFIADTVSGYGMTRLSELNLYYLLAGKLARFVTFPNGFRVFSMLLMGMLTIFVLKNMKKSPYLLVTFFITPQLWYLFSYATSDAFDYCISVFVIYMLAEKNSLLNRLFLEKPGWKYWKEYLLTGFLFACLLMAKKNYYVLLVLAFLILLQGLIFAKKDERKNRWMAYGIILVVTFGIYGIRALPDWNNYGFKKSQVEEQLIEETAEVDYKLSTPVEEKAQSLMLKEKGVTVWEFLDKYKFNERLYENFAGYYGIFTFRNSNWYYNVMGILYLLLLVSTGKMIKQSRLSRAVILQCITGMGCMVLSYTLTFYNAYFVDFQPQGRYMFPAVAVYAYVCSLSPRIEKSRWIRIILVAIGLLSLYSFVSIAWRNYSGW